jgi:hypothetical protein
MRSASEGPSTSSITIALDPARSSSPWMVAMFGWLIDASSLASRSKRAPRSGLARVVSGRTLIATSRPSRGSLAR